HNAQSSNPIRNPARAVDARLGGGDAQCAPAAHRGARGASAGTARHPAGAVHIAFAAFGDRHAGGASPGRHLIQLVGWCPVISRPGSTKSTNRAGIVVLTVARKLGFPRMMILVYRSVH